MHINKAGLNALSCLFLEIELLHFYNRSNPWLSPHLYGGMYIILDLQRK